MNKNESIDLTQIAGRNTSAIKLSKYICAGKLSYSGQLIIQRSLEDIPHLLCELESKDKRIASLETQLKRYQELQDDGRLAELPENESLDIDSSINAITNIVKNDYFVFKGNKTFIVDMFISKDPREETEFIAECKDYQTDSYGVEGSEFCCCGCEDETICKYAGSEFKHWDETDPDPIEIGCRIRFTDRELGKTVFLTEEEAQQALEDEK